MIARETLTRLIRFAGVGVAGFIVDAGLLTALTASGLDPFSARVISIAAAMFTTWRLNRALTFRATGHGTASEAARYGGVALAVAALNYMVYAALMLAFPALWPAMATAISTLVSMAASYLGYARLVFRQPG